MRRWLRRWLQLDKPPAPPVTPSETPAITKKAFGELVERVDYLEEALNRLRGRVTGGLAHQPKPQEATEPAESRQDAPGTTITPESGIPPDRWMIGAQIKARRQGGVLSR